MMNKRKTNYLFIIVSSILSLSVCILIVSLNNSFSVSENLKDNSFHDLLFEDFYPLVTVEYESNSMVVLRTDENSLLILNGTLAPFWNSIDIIKKHGYNLKEISESGMGSKGNPTRFYAILEK